MRKLIIFIDSGDTLVDESTEVREKSEGVVEECRLFPGAKKAMRRLKEEGFRIALVADGLVESFHNIYAQHGLSDCFDVWTISEAVGEHKPSPLMFDDAMRKLSLPIDRESKRLVVMVGNNIPRDIVGANRYGIRSVLVRWSPRYDYTVHGSEEDPTYAIDSVDQLVPLMEKIEKELENGRE